MSPPFHPLAEAADTRRRELPASLALTILTGGLAAAIMEGSAPVGWAAVMSLLLIFDTELYRRLDAAQRALSPRLVAALSAWSLFCSCFYAVLPAALWLDGEAAGAAAAMVLWVAGVVRHFSPGLSGAWPIALAGALPPALSLLGAPIALAAASARADWDLAAMAAVGGGALMAYVTQARLSAAQAERALRQARAQDDMQQLLGRLLLASERTAVVLLDTEGRIVAASRAVALKLNIARLEGVKFEDVIPIPAARWRDAFQRALLGEHVRHSEEEVMLADGRYWYDWETRPWRDDSGALRGVLAIGRDVTSLAAARRMAAENHDLLRIALDAGRSLVWEVDYKTRAIRWYGDCEAIYGQPFTFEEFNDNRTTIIHEDDRLMLADYFTRVAQGEEGSVEHRVLRAGGGVSWAQIHARRVLGRSGGVRKLIVLSIDVTERKQREAAFIAAMHRAETALKGKRALFAEIAPEIEAIDEAAVSVAEMHERLDALMQEMDARDAALAEALVSLRAAREAAETANVSKSQFLASMSHELRTPLNAIIGYSEILLEEAEADGRERDIADIQRVLSSARALLHLINDILDLSKIEAGRMDVAAAPFDVAHLIEEAAATVQPAAEKAGNSLSLDLDPALGSAHTDAFKLNQCLLNLLSNAIKFTERGRVGVRARRERRSGGDWISIAVSDSGIGLSEEQMGRLFNAFVQADASTARRYGGTGLGLAITRKVIQLLGGEVSVESQVGVGSTFTLSLPAQAPASGAASRELAALTGRDGGARMVLLIDDEESARDLTARSLSRLGFNLRTAVDGASGLSLARSEKPSLIVLDINLPDMSGWDVLAQLAAHEETRDIPVLVHSVDDDRARARAAGACELLVKPADRDVLAAAALRFARAPIVSEPAAPARAAKKTA